MVNLEKPQRYSLNPARVGLSAYRLLTHLLASKPLSKLCTGHFACGYDILRDNFEEQEIQHLLIELAISYRMYDDMVKSNDGESISHMNPVGKIWDPIKSKQRDLSLREACNKIIHAECIKFDKKSGPLQHEHFVKSSILLYGKWNNIQWKAKLNILELCESLSLLTS